MTEHEKRNLPSIQASPAARKVVRQIGSDCDLSMNAVVRLLISESPRWIETAKRLGIDPNEILNVSTWGGSRQRDDKSIDKQADEPTKQQAAGVPPSTSSESDDEPRYAPIDDEMDMRPATPKRPPLPLPRNGRNIKR